MMTPTDEKKVAAYDLLRQINAHLAAARQLQNPLANLEAEIAELEKGEAQPQA